MRPRFHRGGEVTPAARIAAAAEILDRVLTGAPAEQALTNWARGNRFAGSGDRRAIRDLVFDALRQRRSLALRGGAETGRGLMIGMIRAVRGDPAATFTGEGHAPAPLSPEEAAYRAPPEAEWPRAVRLDYPDWLEAALDRSLGPDLEAVMERLRLRAPLYLRVNRARTDREEAAAALAAEGIETAPHPLADTALLVTTNARKVAASRAYAEGLVEIQDVSSQAVIAALAPPGARALDYCAGGGGKALALAAAGWGEVLAHDADPGRMRDLPARAARAGARIGTLATADLAAQAPFELVLADAPCSGSGAWRRQAGARWELTPGRLEELTKIQAGILDHAAGLVAPGGRLAYATCSLLSAENEDQAAGFVTRHPGWNEAAQRRFSPLEGGDGFFVAVFTAPGARST